MLFSKATAIISFFVLSLTFNNLFALNKTESFGYVFYDDGEWSFRDGRKKIEEISLSYKLPKKVDLVNEGHEFLYWINDSTGEEITNKDIQTSPNESYYLTSIWGTIYPVILNTNGGTIVKNNLTSYVDIYGATLPSLEDVVREGYLFEGWFLKSTMNETDISIDKIEPFSTGEKIFYAKWKEKAELIKKYKINYFLNGGMIVGEYKADFRHNESVLLPDNVEKEGYLFKGWYKDNKFVDGPYINIFSGENYHHDYYAKFIEKEKYISHVKYKIYLDPRDGKILKDNIDNYISGIGATLPTEVIKEHYEFAGWYSRNFNGQRVFKISETTFGDKYYYAEWKIPSKERKYKINYVLNGGKSKEQFIKEYYYEKIILPKKMSKKYHKFLGWSEVNTINNPHIVDCFENNEFGDKVVYALYEPIIYKINYELSGGNFKKRNVINTYRYGQGCPLPIDVKKDGYIFIGWSKNINNGNDLIKTISSNEHSNITLYAIYVKDTPKPIITILVLMVCIFFLYFWLVFNV